MSLSPGNADDVKGDLARGLRLIRDRQAEYDRREQYYRGERREVITHPKLQKLLDKYGNAFTLNYAAVPCDALMDRVDLMSLTTGDRGTDALLRDRLWMPNSLDDDADDIHLHAAYLGDYYLVAEYIGDEGDQNDDEDESGTGIGTIELTPKHPSSMVIAYQRSNSRIPDFAVQMIQGSAKGEWEALVYYDDETWEFEATETEDGFAFDRYEAKLNDDTGEPDPIFNEVGLFPVFHFRPDRKPYGQPVNQKMYGPQDAITKINATQMAAIDHYGFPVRVALLDPDSPVDESIDDDFNDDVEVPIDGSRSVEGRSKASFEPGGVTMLPGIKSIAQFDAADPRGFLDPLTFHIRAGATLTRTPLYEFDLDGSGDQPSGEARRRADGPITKHAAKIKGQFGSVWTAVGTYALTALNVQAAKQVEAVWAPSETATDNEGIALVALKVENGIPPRQALLEAGYTNEQVNEFLPVDENNGMKVPLTADLIGKLSTALRELGNAKTLGSVTDDQIRRMFRNFFGDVAGNEPLIGSGTFNAFTGSAEADQPSPVDDLASKATALGQLVRAGVRQEDAARILGLTGISFDGTPVALRDDTPGQ